MSEILQRPAVRYGLIGAGATLALIVLFLLTRSEPDQRPDLLELVRAAEAEYSYPGLSVEETVATLGDAEDLIAFVRADVMLADYSGHMLSAGDVLIQRGANAADKAVLLSDLLTAAGFETRLRRADWPSAVPVYGTPRSDRRESLSAIYAYLELDEEAERAINAREEVDRMAAIREEVEAATSLLANYWSAASTPPDTLSSQDWVWVEYRQTGDWQVADPVFPSLSRPADAAAYQATIPAPIRVRLDLVDTGGARSSVLDAEIASGQEGVLRFVPSSGLSRFLDAAPGEVSADAWIPVLSAGSEPLAGSAFTTDGFALPSNAGAALETESQPFAAPEISSAELVDVDVSQYPRVTVSVRTDAAADARWQAAHLSLGVNDEAIAPQILRRPTSLRPFALVTDVSPSMIEDGNIYKAGLLGRALIERMGTDRSFSATSFAGDVFTPRRMTNVIRIPNAVQDFNQTLDIRGGGGAMVEAISSAAGTFWQQGDIFVMTDGRDESLDSREALLAAVNRFPGRVIGIVPADQIRVWQGIFDQIIELPTEADIEVTADALYRMLGTPLEVSFIAPAAEAGENQTLGLAFPDSEITLAGEYIIPETFDASSARLEISLFRDDEQIGDTRQLLQLGQAQTGTALMGVHSLWVSSGRYAPEAPLRRYFHETRLDLEASLEPGNQPSEPMTGPSHMTMSTAASITGRLDRLFEQRVARDEPLAILRGSTPEVTEDGSAYLVLGLDIISDGNARFADGSLDPQLGLALAAIEGAALEASSVNVALLSESDPVEITPRTPIPEGWPRPAQIAAGDTNALFLASADGQQSWIIDNSGHLTARIFPSGAKGARARRAIAEFSELRSNLQYMATVASGIGSPSGVSGAQLGAIAGILDINLRMWCYATVMLGFMNDELATGEREYNWERQASEGCEIDPTNLQGEYIGAAFAGYVTGSAGDRYTDAVKNAAGGSLPWIVEAGVNSGAGGLINLTGVGGGIHSGIREIYSR